MAQIEEIRRPKAPASPAPWPESWSDASQAPAPPAWFYPPPWWAAPQAEAQLTPPGQGKKPTYSGKETAPDALDLDDPRRHLVCIPAVLNVHQAAEYLGVCDEVVYTLVHREDFPGFRIGRIWRIDAQQLGEWVRRQTAGQGVRV